MIMKLSHYLTLLLILTQASPVLAAGPGEFINLQGTQHPPVMETLTRQKEWAADRLMKYVEKYQYSPKGRPTNAEARAARDATLSVPAFRLQQKMKALNGVDAHFYLFTEASDEIARLGQEFSPRTSDHLTSNGAANRVIARSDAAKLNRPQLEEAIEDVSRAVARREKKAIAAANRRLAVAAKHYLPVMAGIAVGGIAYYLSSPSTGEPRSANGSLANHIVQEGTLVDASLKTLSSGGI
jgi:hypothetical protein